MKTKYKGITVQLVNKFNGQAVDRQWFKRLEDAGAWLDNMYPNWRNDYELEIFSD